jgi:hypothetical protein
VENENCLTPLRTAGHSGIKGNEIADKLGRLVATKEFAAVVGERHSPAGVAERQVN